MDEDRVERSVDHLPSTRDACPTRSVIGLRPLAATTTSTALFGQMLERMFSDPGHPGNHRPPKPQPPHNLRAWRLGLFPCALLAAAAFVGMWLLVTLLLLAAA